MPLDYNSLLMAIGFAGVGLAVTMAMSWLSSRTDLFLLTWAGGVALIVAHVFTYSLYVENPRAELQLVAFTLLIGGLAILFGAAREFRTGKVPWRVVMALAAGCTLLFAPATILSLDGLALIVVNLAAAGLLLATAHQYWLGRAEAPTPVSVLSALYAVTGLSFVPCALMIVAGGKLVLGRAPDNWAEDANLIVAIGGITGIGALSLALNQWRLAGRHRQDSHTDQLTGLLNRRALFNHLSGTPIDRFTGVLLFDLDHFKAINDQFGHGAGDEVLRRFASVLIDCLRATDVVARLGGEEFVAVLPRTTTDRAHQIAESVRKATADLAIDTEQGSLRCTVSVGIAFPTDEGRSFDQVLSDADKALYRAKQGGRNRVATANLRLAG